MKKTILSILTVTIMSWAAANDSTKLEPLHNKMVIPIHTPFLSTFETDSSVTNDRGKLTKWFLTFVMIVNSKEEIYYEPRSKDCGLVTCYEAWKIHVYDSTIPDTDRIGYNLEDTLASMNIQLVKTLLPGGLELHSFIKPHLESPFGRPFKVTIGEHPPYSETKGIKVHDGGSIHWPSGD